MGERDVQRRETFLLGHVVGEGARERKLLFL